MKNTLQDIQDTAHNLDIFGEASELEAAQFVDDLTGDNDTTPDEDQNVPDSMPLPDALNFVTASRGDSIQFLTGIAEQMLAKFSAKSEDVKATQDSRTLNHQMAMGVKAVLVEWGARLAEAEERVQQSTPDERRRTGVNSADILEPEAEDRRPPSVPSAGVRKNTAAAQEWLKKSDATRS
jgi:hypothetical protein